MTNQKKKENKPMSKYLNWIYWVPLLTWIAYFLGFYSINPLTQLISAGLLIFSVMAAVFHSEHIAEKIGEPFGTIILAVSITIIEVGLIISLMLSGGDKTIYLARDTIFSSVMILLNAILGLCLIVGSTKHFVQTFQVKSANISLVSLMAILVLTLVLPNFTQSAGSGNYSIPQLIFAAVACLVIYGTFLAVQTVRHKSYFIPDYDDDTIPGHGPETGNIWVYLIFLFISLAIVVLLAKSLSPLIEAFINAFQLPHALLGVIIASIVLLPEGIAAVKAAYKDRLQISINLTLGSALAAIGLTIPSVAIVSTLFGLDITLGLSLKSMVLLALSVFTVMLSLSKGTSNILYGVVLLVTFAAFIFTTIFP